MFDGSDHPQSLDEDLFEKWLEKGRSSLLGYNYLLIIWNEREAKYLPVYAENKSTINDYESYGMSSGYESLIALYDLYSESRISVS